MAVRAIVNRYHKFGELDGKIAGNSEVLKIIIQYVKKGKAKLVIDTDSTLMYYLDI